MPACFLPPFRLHYPSVTGVSVEMFLALDQRTGDTTTIAASNPKRLPRVMFVFCKSCVVPPPWLVSTVRYVGANTESFRGGRRQHAAGLRSLSATMLCRRADGWQIQATVTRGGRRRPPRSARDPHQLTGREKMAVTAAITQQWAVRLPTATSTRFLPLPPTPRAIGDRPPHVPRRCA